jgi:hypothetical protein
LLMGILFRGGLAGNSPPSCWRLRFLKKGRLFRGRVVISRHLSQVASNDYFDEARSTKFQSVETETLGCWQEPMLEGPGVLWHETWHRESPVMNLMAAKGSP